MGECVPRSGPASMTFRHSHASPRPLVVMTGRARFELAVSSRQIMATTADLGVLPLRTKVLAVDRAPPWAEQTLPEVAPGSPARTRGRAEVWCWRAAALGPRGEGDRPRSAYRAVDLDRLTGIGGWPAVASAKSSVTVRSRWFQPSETELGSTWTACCAVVLTVRSLAPP